MVLSVINFLKVALALLNNILELARTKALVNQGRTEAFDETLRQTEAKVTTATQVANDATKTHVTNDTDDAFDQEFERR